MGLRSKAKMETRGRGETVQLFFSHQQEGLQLFYGTAAQTFHFVFRLCCSLSCRYLFLLLAQITLKKKQKKAGVQLIPCTIGHFTFTPALTKM